MKECMGIPELPSRPMDGHKGTFGTVVVAGGSIGMAGAVGLCARAVLRSGAGLCQMACPEEIQPFAALLAPCATSIPVVSRSGAFFEGSAAQVLEAARQAGTLALGPGLGRGEDQARFMEAMLKGLEVPTVIDADGLNSIAFLSLDSIGNGDAPLVLTPHPGEAARLMKVKTREIQEKRMFWAGRIAGFCKGVCVLKGHETIVTDGERFYINKTGNPGMATGGSGDVLTGVISGLIAQGLAPFDASVLGTWLHGKAGDIAEEELGAWSITAEDIIERLPGAFLERMRMAGR